MAVTLSEQIRHDLSLMHGWIPATVQVIAVVALIAAIGWRTRRWRLIWVPWAALVGVALAVTAYWYVASEGLADNPAPHALWIWIGLSGAAAAVLVAGWRGARWWRRGASVLALPLSLLCAALALNLWVGYFPTVQTAWNQLTAGPLPDQTDPVDRDRDAEAAPNPGQGHRGAGAASPTRRRASSTAANSSTCRRPGTPPNPPPPLPTVMMIGGEFNTPADWLRAGNAVKTVDDFAAAHGGNAPVLVFVDAGGAFNNDTECVNGSPRQCRRPPHQRRRAIYDFALRRERATGRTGASSAGRWAAHAPSTSP